MANISLDPIEIGTTISFRFDPIDFNFQITPYTPESPLIFNFGNPNATLTTPLFDVTFTSDIAASNINMSQLNVNLQSNCNSITQPLNVDVCQAGYSVNFASGSVVSTEIFSSTGAQIELFDIPFGQSANVILQNHYIFYPVFDFGQELNPLDIQGSVILPIEFESGQELKSDELALPPRAILELNSEYGSELLDTPLNTTSLLNLDAYFGHNVDADLTPACLGVIPLNTWITRHLDVDCSSVHRTGGYAKYYTFELLSDKVVTIDTSSTFDNYIFLLNGIGSGGSVLDFDDNSGAGQNARIVISLLAGNYTVEFTSSNVGDLGQFDLIVRIPSSVISAADAYHGSEIFGLPLSTQRNLHIDNWFGSDCSFELKTNEFAKFDVVNGFGSEILPFDIIKTSNFELNIEYGSDTNVSLQINEFAKFDIVNEFGQELNKTTLSTSEQISVNEFGTGVNSEVDLTINPFSELSVEYAHGQEILDLDIYNTATFNCYASFGSDSTFDLELALSEGLGVLTGYYGSGFELDAIDTDELTLRFQHGSEVSIDIKSNVVFSINYEYGIESTFDFDVKPFDTLEVGYEHGTQLEDPTLSTSIIFSLSSETGITSEFDDLTLPSRAIFGADAKHGLEANIKETILNLRPIEYNVGLDFYIKHNHCESCCDNVDPVYGDSTIRFETNEDYHNGYLIVDFSKDNYKDDYPWTGCDTDEVKFDLGLSTNPRFQVEFQVEGLSSVVFMPPELTAFIDGVPLEYLYLDTSPKPQTHTFAVDFNISTASWVWGEDWTAETVYTRHAPHLEVELTDTRYVEMYNGEAFTLETIVTDVPEWKTDAFSPINVSSSLDITLELNDYIRFCPGYIIPNGNQINFEFYGVESTGCNVERIYHASMLAIESISTSQNYQPHYGAAPHKLSVILTTELPWQVQFGYAPLMLIDNLNTDVKMTTRDMGHGSRVDITLEPITWNMYHSPVECFAELAVPGPDLLWVTPPGCLPNQYIRVNEDGDIDLEYYQPDPTKDFIEYPFGITIENRHYKHNLDARCVKK